VTMSGIKLTIDVIRAGGWFGIKHIHIVSSVCKSQDESHCTVQKSTKARTLLASISSFPDRQEGGIMSPSVAVLGITEPYPRKYDKEGQDGLGSKNEQEVDRGILYNRHDDCRNLTKSAEGEMDDRNEPHSICEVCTLACSLTSMLRT